MSAGAWETLRAHDELDEEYPPYPRYLTICRGLAARTQTDLRTLDRALWTWPKEKGIEDEYAEEPDDGEQV